MTSHNPPAPVRLYATASKCLLTLTTLTLTLPGGRFTGLAEITPSVQGSATVEGPPLDLGGLGVSSGRFDVTFSRDGPGDGRCACELVLWDYAGLLVAMWEGVDEDEDGREKTVKRLVGSFAGTWVRT